MPSAYDALAVVGLVLAAMAYWKVSRIERFTNFDPSRTKKLEPIETAHREPKNPRLPIPANSPAISVDFFRFYEDAVTDLNKMHQHDPFSFDNERLKADVPEALASDPTRTIAIYYGDTHAGRITLKRYTPSLRHEAGKPFEFWADFELWAARQYRGRDVEWLVETIAWLVVDSKDDLEAVRRNTLDSMARWTWQIGNDAPVWGTFAERFTGHGRLWRSDWSSASGTPSDVR